MCSNFSIIIKMFRVNKIIYIKMLSLELQTLAIQVLLLILLKISRSKGWMRRRGRRTIKTLFLKSKSKIRAK